MSPALARFEPFGSFTCRNSELTPAVLWQPGMPPLEFTSAMESGKLICARLKIKSPPRRATGIGVDGYQLSFRGFA